MKAVCALLTLALLAVTGPCGSPEASSAGAYDIGPGPSPSESVRTVGKVLTVDEGLGDRMFTHITSRYDAATLMLLSSERNASCCGESWHSTVTRNADGSFWVESQAALPSPDGKDVYIESRPHLEALANFPIVIGGLFFVPWIRHVLNATDIMQIEFDPLRTRYLKVAETSAAPYPDRVPAHDKALLVTSPPDQATTLWYDPCTFTLDAYGTRDGYIAVRHGLLK